MKYLKIVLVIAILLLISSCLSIETEVELKKDGSGTARFSYSVSTLAADIGKIDSDNKILPIPIMEEDFDIAARKAGGIEIKEYKLTENGTRYLIESEIDFDSLESLSIFSGSDFLLEQNGNNKILRVTIYDGSGDEEVSQQTIDMVRENFSEDLFSFSILIPGDIVRVTDAVFSGSTVSFSISVEELIINTGPVTFSVEYR